MPSWGLRAQLIQLAPSAPPRTQARSRRAGLPQRACMFWTRRALCTAPRAPVAAATFLAFLRPHTMREASPQSPQQEQRYLRDVFRERGDFSTVGRGPCRAARRAAAAVTDSPARVPPPLEGTERDTRQPEDTTAPRKSAAERRSPMGRPALSSKRFGAPSGPLRTESRAPSTPLGPASLFTSPASDDGYDNALPRDRSARRWTPVRGAGPVRRHAADDAPCGGCAFRSSRGRRAYWN